MQGNTRKIGCIPWERWSVQKHRLPIAGGERDDGNHGDHAFVDELMFHAGGDAHRGTGLNGDPALVEQVLAVALLDVEDFLAIGMVVERITLARMEMAEPECLGGAGEEFGVGEPLQGAPGEGLDGQIGGEGQS